MTSCLGGTLRKAGPADARPVTGNDHSDRASSEEALGDRVENLPPHDSDPQRMVEKMTSGMAKPKKVSNKCILV
jgi:hypothetical protein